LLNIEADQILVINKQEEQANGNGPHQLFGKDVGN
jgi:hypothetical protein